MGCQSSAVSSDATTRGDLNQIGAWGVCGCDDSSKHLVTLGVDPYWSAVWQCWDRAYSLLLVVHFLLSLFHLLVLLSETFKVDQLGMRRCFVSGTPVLSLLPISSSPGLRPHQGKGVARYIAQQ